MKRVERAIHPTLRITQGARLAELPQLARVPEAIRRDIRVVSQVLPFRVNAYVLEELIDWDAVPDDPIFRLTFPHRDMLSTEDYAAVAGALDAGVGQADLGALVGRIRRSLNPDPGGQIARNVPERDGTAVPGLQHKYRETVLAFPSQGQVCHSYCTYCFRWPQFVGEPDLRQAHRESDGLAGYLTCHPEVSDVLFTGGDPLTMSTAVLARYIEPLLEPALEHVRTVRLGTKALSWWPHRFLSDTDADDLLRLIEKVRRHGKHVAVMAHVTHPRELETHAVDKAIARLHAAGAVIRTQSPIVRHINDSAATWRALWQHQIQMGLIPYYMFVERQTGAARYFELPLAEALAVYREASGSLSGLGRTARGPCMSAEPGKVVVDGVTDIAGERVFALRFLQARNPRWVGRPFFARYDPDAVWWNDLRPAGGEARFFFEDDAVQDWRERAVAPEGA